MTLLTKLDTTWPKVLVWNADPARSSVKVCSVFEDMLAIINPESRKLVEVLQQM